MSLSVSNWGLYLPYFCEREFICKCELCQRLGKALVEEKLLVRLYLARSLAGVPFVILSGCRCWEHNKNVGGAAHSDHLTRNEGNEVKLCSAVDIRATQDSERFMILSALFKAGFSRIGIAKSYIHAGVSVASRENLIWVYGR
ncbi:MAG: D-Ala-D-Ala carboxypeptidase family metallohydrolase [Candidatus Cloacimonetes bacterium]|nr:D-Ala-D-Ala carboxypeptidase family metallohydrolase [Candidatus Cloacimonadota bacterium]